MRRKEVGKRYSKSASGPCCASIDIWDQPPGPLHVVAVGRAEAAHERLLFDVDAIGIGGSEAADGQKHCEPVAQCDSDANDGHKAPEIGGVSNPTVRSLFHDVLAAGDGDVGCEE